MSVPCWSWLHAFSVCLSVLTHAGKQRHDLQFPLSQQTLVPKLPLSKSEVTLPDSLMENAIFLQIPRPLWAQIALNKVVFYNKLNVIMWFATKGHCLYFPMNSVHIRFPGIRRPSLYPDYKDYTIYISIYCVYYKYTDLYKTIREAARIITVFTRHILLREIHSVNTINTVSLVIYNTVIVCWTCMAAQCYVSFNCSHLLKHP